MTKQHWKAIAANLVKTIRRSLHINLIKPNIKFGFFVYFPRNQSNVNVCMKFIRQDFHFLSRIVFGIEVFDQNFSINAVREQRRRNLKMHLWGEIYSLAGALIIGRNNDRPIWVYIHEFPIKWRRKGYGRVLTKEWWKWLIHILHWSMPAIIGWQFL